MLDSGGWRKAVPGKSALEHRARKRQQEKPPVTEKSEMLLLFYLSVPWEDQCEQGPAVPAGRGLRKVFWVREEPQQGSAGTPWSFTRVGGSARDRAAAPAEPPGPFSALWVLLVPAWPGRGWVVAQGHCWAPHSTGDTTASSSFPGSQEIPAVQNFPCAASCRGFCSGHVWRFQKWLTQSALS